MRVVLILLCALLPRATFAEPLVTLVRVLKSDHKLQLLAGETVLHEFHAVFGANPKGHKTQEGDERTPEGVYILDYKKSDSAFYKSIHISYPNARDIALAKARGVDPGGQIMIHGQRNGIGSLAFITQHMNWTDGCVALSNSDMDVVWKLVREGTPIDIRP
jgi:murein L,D-transpeptidase YafK